MFELHPGKLSLEVIQELLNSHETIQLTPSAYSIIENSYDLVQTIIDQDKTVYGINTGFGLLANQKIEKEALKELQKRIVLSHAAGVGEPLSDKIVQLMLLLKINSLSQGYSGVSKTLIDTLIALYNHRIYPIIPSQGSVGASGDLAPLAHMAMALIGEGDVKFDGKPMPASQALSLANISPIELQEKEGLALLNGTQASTAIALVALLNTQRNVAIATIAGALSIDAIAGSIKPFSAFISLAKNSKEQGHFSALITELLKDSEILRDHRQCPRVQDPYSIRCQPQVMGAVLTYLKAAQINLINEANGVSDNPLICLTTHEIISGGNFHAEMTAISADLITITSAEIGAIAERRISLLIDKHLSGLPAFLVKEPGLNSGFMLAHVTATALASENKTFAHPGSVDSLPTSANQEDHVSMATFCAFKSTKVAENSLMILAIETLAACQGIDLRAPLKTSPMLQHYKNQLRKQVAFYEQDRYFAKDIELAKQVISDPTYYGEVYEKLFLNNPSL